MATVDQGISQAQSHLAEFKATGDEHALSAAWDTASGAIRDAGVGEARLGERFQMAGVVALAFFDYIGNFAWLDGAIEMLRRSAFLRGVPPDPERRWNIQHADWPGAVVRRSLADDEWAIFHPDGRVSQILGKDWTAYPAGGWPMGWTIRTPDGSRLTFEENHFGDGWMITETSTDTVSSNDDIGLTEQSLTGFATIGQTRYSYTVSPDGFKYEPAEAPRPKLFGRKTDSGGYVPADQVAVLRVMPMGDTHAFAMFAMGTEAEDVFLSMTLWGQEAVEKPLMWASSLARVCSRANSSACVITTCNRPCG